MKEYLALCLDGSSTIPERKNMLQAKKLSLQQQIQNLHEAIEYIDEKQKFYDEVLSGEREYVNNLVPRHKKDSPQTFGSCR